MSVTFANAEPSIADVGDYIELMKPRVMSLAVFTALVGLSVAPGHIHPVIGFNYMLKDRQKSEFDPVPPQPLPPRLRPSPFRNFFIPWCGPAAPALDFSF